MYYQLIVNFLYVCLAFCGLDLGLKLFSKGNKITSAEFMKKRHLKKTLSGSSNALRISEKIILSIKNCLEHILIVAPTGSGKSTSIFIPNLLNKNIKGSIVQTDPKKELFKKTCVFQLKQGRIPLYFNPLDPKFSLKYNPLIECNSMSEISQLAETLMINGSKSLEIQTGMKSGGIEWIQMSQGLLTASLMYCKEKGYPLDNITTAIRLITENPLEDLDALFSTCSDEIIDQYNLFKMVADSERTAASIKVTIASNLKLFLDRNIIETTSSSDFSAKDLREREIALYISYAETKSAYLSPLLGVLYTQLINKMMEIEGNDIFFMMDEFANIGIINNFNSIVSTARSRGISFMICLQDLAQLEQLYGRYNARTILNNLKTKCVLHGLSDIETLRYISELLGNTEVQITNSNDVSSVHVKRLLSADEIRTLDKNKILIIAQNKQPIMDQLNIYYKKNEYLELIKEVDINKWNMKHL